MPEIEFEGIITTVHAVPALDAALRAELGDVYNGVSTVKSKLVVLLSDKASASDSNKARQLVNRHDFDTRTDEQLTQERGKTAFAEVVGKDTNAGLLAAIEADETALGGKPDTAALRAILANVIAREKMLVMAMQHLDGIK